MNLMLLSLQDSNAESETADEWSKSLNKQPKDKGSRFGSDLNLRSHNKSKLLHLSQLLQMSTKATSISGMLFVYTISFPFQFFVL